MSDALVLSMQRLVDTGVSIPGFAFPANKNAPRPDRKYATVKLIEERPQGYPEKTELELPSGDLVFRTQTMKIAIFDILFLKDEEEVREMASCFSRQDVLDVMLAEKMAVLSCSLIDNRTVELETNWEPRAGLRIVTNVIHVQDSTMIEIKQAGYTGTIDKVIIQGETNARIR